MPDLNKSQTTLLPVRGHTIPSREEHNRFIRRLWQVCIGAAILVFILTGGVVLGMFVAGYDSKKVVEISTSVFQVLILSYGLGFFVPAFLTSLAKMGLGVEMSRQGLEIGKETADTLERLKKDVGPIIEDLKGIVGPARELVEDLKSQRTGQIVAFVEKLSENGTVERLTKAVEEIGQKVHEAIKRVEKGAVDKMVDNI